MRKLLPLIAIVVIAAAAFGVTDAIDQHGRSDTAQAAHKRVCIRIHHLRWCFGTRSRATVKLARAVKATYRADKTHRLTVEPARPMVVPGGAVTFTCTQPEPGEYVCSPS